MNFKQEITLKRYHMIFMIMAFYALLVVRFAWVSDDAFITFRVVDNFVNGYGLRWNVDERVQVFTNPFWMLMHVPFYYLTGNIYLTTIALSLTVSLLAILIVVTARVNTDHGGEHMQAAVIFCAVLFGSETVRSFATSGLETPMIMLLFALFFNTAIKDKFSTKDFYFLCFIAALAFFNRMDTVLILVPVLLYFFFKDFRKMQIWRIIMSFAPAILWVFFALCYYGFIFPNTKYAKLNAGIALMDYLKQGGAYYIDIILRDTIVFVLLFAVSGLTLLCVLSKRVCDKISVPQKSIYLCLGLGVILQGIYVLYVGGDFMSGRFLLLPYFACACMLYRFAYHSHFSIIRLLPYYICFIILMNMTYILEPQKFVKGIVSERMYYYAGTGLFTHKKDWMRTKINFRFNKSMNDRIPVKKPLQNHNKQKEQIILKNTAQIHGGNPQPAKPSIQKTLQNKWVEKRFEHQMNIEAKKQEQQSIDVEKREKINDVYVIGVAGMNGFFGGPTVRLIDLFALTDTLLARLPTRDVKRWRIGHFLRNLPQGYILARRDGDFRFMPQSLAEYYQHLRVVTMGDLWTIERWNTILNFQLGRYDYLLRR